MPLIIGVDPGKATGVAVSQLSRIVPENMKVSPEYKSMFGSWELTTLYTETVSMTEAPEGFEAVIHLAPIRDGLIVVCERFTVSRITIATQQHQSLEVIGMLKSALARHGLLDALIMQQPSEAKMMFPNRKMVQLGVYTKKEHGKISDHEMDALRHTAQVAHRWVHGKAQMYTPNAEPSV